MAQTVTEVETRRPPTGEALIDLAAVEKAHRLGKLDYRARRPLRRAVRLGPGDALRYS
jgi:hypothetical protein